MNDESGWLIESNLSSPSGPRWLRVITHGADATCRAEIVWTNDSAVALRFARLQDAEFFAYLHPEHCTLARCTEHEWVAAPPKGYAIECHGEEHLPPTPEQIAEYEAWGARLEGREPVARASCDCIEWLCNPADFINADGRVPLYAAPPDADARVLELEADLREANENVERLKSRVLSAEAERDRYRRLLNEVSDLAERVYGGPTYNAAVTAIIEKLGRERDALRARFDRVEERK